MMRTATGPGCKQSAAHKALPCLEIGGPPAVKAEVGLGRMLAARVAGEGTPVVAVAIASSRNPRPGQSPYMCRSHAMPVCLCSGLQPPVHHWEPNPDSRTGVGSQVTGQTRAQTQRAEGRAGAEAHPPQETLAGEQSFHFSACYAIKACQLALASSQVCYDEYPDRQGSVHRWMCML